LPAKIPLAVFVAELPKALKPIAYRLSLIA
jgi:hypothetical protein